MAMRTKLEQELWVMTRRLTHYAACLEEELIKTGNSALADERYVSPVADARALIGRVKGA